MKKMILAACLILSSLQGEEAQCKIELTFPKNKDSQNSKTESLSPKNQRFPAGYLLSIGEHQIIAKSADGLIELEDGTQFKVIPEDCALLENWDFYDLITFSPSSYWARCEFYIINERTGNYLRANIWASPAVENPEALRLCEINAQKEEVVLSTQQGMKMRWKIHSKDFKKIDAWEIADMIVIGKNITCFSTWVTVDPYILVSYAASDKVLYLRATPKPL